MLTFICDDLSWIEFLSGALDCLRAIDEAEFVADSFDFDETLFRRDIFSLLPRAG